MKTLAKIFLSLCFGATMILPFPASAADFKAGGMNLWVEGFIRQELSFNYNSNSPTNESGLHSAYQMWYLESVLGVTDNLEVRMINRLWGDLIYALKGHANHFEKYFKGAKKDFQWDDDGDDIMREFYVTYFSDKFFIRAGKQQIGWGESDGIRLMDVVNPTDNRRDALFYDTIGFEEVRIPKWLLRLEFYPGMIGSIYDTAIQFIWNPGDVRETREELPGRWDTNNAFFRGEAFAIPHDTGVWGIKTPAVPVAFRMIKDKRKSSIDNSEFGLRISGNYHQTFMTLSFWSGFAPGGGYYLNEVQKFRGIEFEPTVGFPFLEAEFERQYPRIKLLGFTLNKELVFVGQTLKASTAPVLRIEAMFSFDEKFNTLEMTTAPLDMNKIDDTDFFRYMIGFDWPMRLNWLNNKRNTFISGQFFHFYTFNHNDGAKSPTMLGMRVPEHWFFGTFKIDTAYLNERVVPSALFAKDFHTGAAWCMTECGFRIGNHWRPKIRWLWIGKGHKKNPARSFNVWENRDQISLRLEYQFQ